ncbi:hypothetical protein [Limobrevibacterium gyesilva]|uniref:Uncharacterized protein n=1 Tax=Limobrevibacterium gyesilva TaxID=2991712 RepID=A0AA41YYU1_9PROT|nr:hypothetical protein [Limobrevibacterium gyesilva]MCW3477747.1 hypothetical protein [Limobrevibacterium gyesilva]
MLLLPLAVILFTGDDARLSPVEQAIVALPIAGDADADAGATTSPLGVGGRLPASFSMPLYANSARAEALRISMRGDDAATPGDGMDFLGSEFATLHPRSRAGEGGLIGHIQLMYSTPMALDLSATIFQEFCNAQPGDPFFDADVATLPIAPRLREALTRFIPTAANITFCPRLAR